MATSESSAALVLFSGGQDSTTCLAWALSRYDRVETIGFSYGQRHIVEMDVRERIRTILCERFPQWESRLGPDRILPLDAIPAVAESALLVGVDLRERPDGLPTSFVPGRNILFLTFAAIIAIQRDLKTLVAGMCETDFSGYPDCRDDTIKAVQVALNLGMNAKLTIETPLMWIDKAATWELAAELGGESLLEVVRKETHTCYLGDRANWHSWGFGCGSCEACHLRERGWKRYMAGHVGA